VLYAAAVAAPLALLAGRGRRPWAMALALGAGFLTTQIVATGWPRLPPVASSDRLALVAAAATVAGTLASGGAGWLLVAGVAVAAPALLVRAAEREILVFGAATLLPLAAVERYARRRPGVTPPIALAILMGGAGAALALHARAALYGQLAGALAASLFAVAAVALLRPGTTLARGALAVPMTLFPALLVLGHRYAELPLRSGLAFATAPLLVWCGASRLGPWGAPAACALGAAAGFLLAR
jgi:hypothetical protein